jgi:lipoic acid synthetase
MVIERKPAWFKTRPPGGAKFLSLRSLIRDSGLNTVCEEARCPNIGDCWDRQTATFMILGDTCTWRCHYCAVNTGKPAPIDIGEPIRLASAVEKLGLRYCVITSVTRGDVSDGGISIFVACVRKIREKAPFCKIELLVPDLSRWSDKIELITDVKPDVLNHNIETVERIFPKIRPQGKYQRSLDLLKRFKDLNSSIPTKSGIMIGLGETIDEICNTMKDLHNVGCEMITIGQYLRPSKSHFPLNKYYTPAEFDILGQFAKDIGFKHVASGPLVRSSYHADEQALNSGLLNN